MLNELHVHVHCVHAHVHVCLVHKFDNYFTIPEVHLSHINLVSVHTYSAIHIFSFNACIVHVQYVCVPIINIFYEYDSQVLLKFSHAYNTLEGTISIFHVAYLCSKPTSSGSDPQLVAANIMAIHDNAGIRISQQV